ncbi:CBASS cGAMP-activated phospholipase [Sphingomicrobium sp. XHP0239]|uniref:CBASS cGAMP-activated phospholipase n=1 Tax=Sphingomicrobium maritimum TaxID=3133972 RepID=UPI0031CCBEB2
MSASSTSAERALAPLPTHLRSDGLRQDRRQQLPWQQEEFRILSIDGGGIRGILPASILTECERAFTGGTSAGRYFDMIAGTSTGGIIALGLGHGLPASQVLDLYLKHGGEIFPSKPKRTGWREKMAGWIALARNVRKVRYRPDVLNELLVETFGTSVLGESTRRLVIPTFDGNTKVNVLKTPHHPDFQQDWKQSMVDVALATSAAPTYFPPHKVDEKVYADGGVWANNPVMLALVDALTCYDLDRHSVRILSLGCSSGKLSINEKQINRGGLWDWREVVTAAMDLSGQNADGQAGLLIGRERLLRIDQCDQKKSIALDDYAEAKSALPSLAKELFNRHHAKLQEFFSVARPETNAYYGPRSLLETSEPSRLA